MRRYGAAVGLTVLTTAIGLLLSLAWEVKFPLPMFYPAVFLGARYGGLLPPENSILVTEPHDVAGLLVFGVVGLLMSALGENYRRSKRRTEAGAGEEGRAMTWRRSLIAFAAVLALVVARDAGAGPPTDQLRRSIDLVLKTLEDPELRKEGRSAERRAAIRTIADAIFDFGEISQRSLGRHWQARTPAEREEFIRLFGDLLERSYITKIEGYTGEKLLYVGEALDGDLATVKTRIVTKQGTEIPVDYRMSRNGDRWRAYDVTIEGISLVGNYRTQFNTIIQRASYQELVAKLKAKQDERPGERATGRRPEPPPPVAPPLPTRQLP